MHLFVLMLFVYMLLSNVSCAGKDVYYTTYTVSQAKLFHSVFVYHLTEKVSDTVSYYGQGCATQTERNLAD